MFSPGTPGSSHHLKHVYFRSNCGSKMILGLNERVVFSLCGPVMEWRPVQGVP